MEKYFMILSKRFHKNHIELNPGKCQYIVIDDNDFTKKYF